MINTSGFTTREEIFDELVAILVDVQGPEVETIQDDDEVDAQANLNSMQQEILAGLIAGSFGYLPTLEEMCRPKKFGEAVNMICERLEIPI